MIGIPTNNDSVVSHVIALPVEDVLVTSTSILEITTSGSSGSGTLPEYSMI